MKSIKQILEDNGIKYGEHLSPNNNSRYGSNIQCAIIHTIECPETSNAAENTCIYWFGTVGARSSAHYVGDNDSVMLCVPEDLAAWTAPGMNTAGLNYEMAGRAGQGAAGWSDQYSQDALRNAAVVFAYWSIKYGIPPRRITPAEMRAGVKGMAGHVDVNAAFHKSDHTDPGPTFPWGKFLGMVKVYIKQISGAPAVVPTPSQKLAVDGQFGPRTIQVLQKFLGVPADGIVGPQTVKALQRWAGTNQDGLWGALTTKAIQTKLGVKVDGLFGPQTIMALQKFLNGKVK